MLRMSGLDGTKNSAILGVSARQLKLHLSRSVHVFDTCKG